MDRQGCVGQALRSRRVRSVCVKAVLLAFCGFVASPCHAQPATANRSASSESLEIERQPYRISVHLSFDPSARFDLARQAQLVRDWQVLVKRVIGIPGSRRSRLPRILCRALISKTSRPMRFEMRTLRHRVVDTDLGRSPRLRASAKRPWIRCWHAADWARSGRRLSHQSRTRPRPLPVHSRSVQSDGAASWDRKEGRIAQGSWRRHYSGDSCGSRCQSGRDFSASPSGIDQRRVDQDHEDRGHLSPGREHRWIGHAVHDRDRAQRSIYPANEPPLHAGCLWRQARECTDPSKIRDPARSGAPPRHFPRQSSPLAAGYTLTARSLPDGPPREIGLTDRAGRIVLKTGFADGLVMLCLFAGNVEPMVEFPVMPGDSDEENTIPIVPKPLTMALEAQLDSLYDEIIDLIALRGALQKRHEGTTRR